MPRHQGLEGRPVAVEAAYRARSWPSLRPTAVPSWNRSRRCRKVVPDARHACHDSTASPNASIFRHVAQAFQPDRLTCRNNEGTDDRRLPTFFQIAWETTAMRGSFHRDGGGFGYNNVPSSCGWGLDRHHAQDRFTLRSMASTIASPLSRHCANDAGSLSSRHAPATSSGEPRATDFPANGLDVLTRGVRHDQRAQELLLPLGILRARLPRLQFDEPYSGLQKCNNNKT